MAVHQVLLAVYHSPFAEDVLVGIDIGIDQPPAFVIVCGRSGPAGDRFQDIEEIIGLDDADRHGQRVQRNAEVLSEQCAGRLLGIPGRTELDGRLARPMRRMVASGVPPSGKRLYSLHVGPSSVSL